MTSDTAMNTVSAEHIHAATILGVRADAVSMDEAISRIERMATGNGKYYVVPLNPEMIIAAQSNAPFREAINSASLVLPDGIGVVLAARYLGQPVTERVTGVDTTQRIAALAAQSGLRLFLLGAAPGIAERAAHRLKEQHAGLTIAGTYAGSPHPDEEETIIALINAARPHILLIAYGAPKQELWVSRNKQRLSVPVTVCVGGTLDFIAGIIPRAPMVFRRVGLEWLYRLLRQPSRWRRMLALPRFAWAVVVHGKDRG